MADRQTARKGTVLDRNTAEAQQRDSALQLTTPAKAVAATAGRRAANASSGGSHAAGASAASAPLPLNRAANKCPM
eukprot:SAG22_NODE_727_length_7598_cov_89.922523_2_plen_76_part_00